MQTIEINRLNQKNNNWFDEIKNVIKECKTETVSEVLFSAFNYAEIKIVLDSDDSYCIKLGNKFSAFSMNDKILFGLDKEFHKKWRKFVKEEFKRQYGVV